MFTVLGLHCLQKYLFRGFPEYKGLILYFLYNRFDPHRVCHTDGGRLIAVGSKDRKVRFIDNVSGREHKRMTKGESKDDELPIITGHAGSVRCVHIIEEKDIVLSGSYDTSIRYSTAKGRGGTGGHPPPPPLKNHKNIGFHSNTGPDLLKNHKACIQCWAIIGTPVKCHLNVISLGSQGWPTFSGIWIPSSTEKNLSKF